MGKGTIIAVVVVVVLAVAGGAGYLIYKNMQGKDVVSYDGTQITKSYTTDPYDSDCTVADGKIYVHIADIEDLIIKSGKPMEGDDSKHNLPIGSDLSWKTASDSIGNIVIQSATPSNLKVNNYVISDRYSTGSWEMGYRNGNSIENYILDNAEDIVDSMTSKEDRSIKMESGKWYCLAAIADCSVFEVITVQDSNANPVTYRCELAVIADEISIKYLRSGSNNFGTVTGDTDCALTDAQIRQLISRNSDKLGVNKYYSFTEIYNSEQFAAIQNGLGGKYLLMSDLRLNDVCIGATGSSYLSFSGELAGAGHTVTYNYHRNPYSVSNYAYAGLFASIDGVVSDLRVDCDIVATKTTGGTVMCVGGIGGSVGAGRVSNCTVTGSVATDDNADKYTQELYLGGVVGCTRGSGTITKCINEAKVSGYASWSHVGGILGGTVSGTSTISNCLNKADVSSSTAKGFLGLNSDGYRADAGGVIGVVKTGQCTITRCCSTAGSIIADGRAYSTILDVGANTDAGGIIGGVENTNYYTMDKCLFLMDSLYERNAHPSPDNVVVDRGRDDSKITNSYGTRDQNQIVEMAQV